MEAGPLLRRRDRRPRRRDRRRRDAQPLLRGAGADRPPLLARRPLPAAQLGLRRRRPGRRLRRRGDGPLRLRRRLRRRRRRVGLGADPRPALPGAAARRRALRRALDRRPRLLPDGARHPRPRRQPGFGDPAAIGHLLLERFLLALRGLLDPAPARRGRARSCSRQRTARRPRRSTPSVRRRCPSA